MESTFFLCIVKTKPKSIYLPKTLDETVKDYANWEYISETDLFELKLPVTFSGTVAQIIKTVEDVVGLRPKILKPAHNRSCDTRFMVFDISF